MFIKNNMSNKSGRYIAGVVLVTIAILPHCDFLKKKTVPEGQPLMSINGSPVVTTQTLEGYIQQAREANPQVDLILQMVPNAQHDIFYKTLVNDYLVREWARRAGVTNRPEYLEKRRRLLELVDSTLATEFFRIEFAPVISDEQILEYYEQNKACDPGLMLAPAGIRVDAVMFTNREEAEKFAALVRKSDSNFAEIAQAHNLKLNNFGGLVHKNSMMEDPRLREKILGMKRLPRVELFVLDAKHVWVVKGYEERDIQCLPLEQASDTIRNMLRERSANEQYQQKLQELSREYAIVEHPEYWESLKQKSVAPQESEDSTDSCDERDDEA